MKLLSTIFSIILLAFFSFSAWAQTVITGRINDSTSTSPIVGASITIKNSFKGTVSKEDGSFQIAVEKLPVTIIVSYLGYGRKEIIVANDAPLNIALLEQTLYQLSEIIISASRTEESSLKAPVTVEKLGLKQLQETPAVSAYDALQYVKGVDLLTQSLGFKSVNMRGFGANNNNRFVQLVDGMDNRSPGLGFGFGSAAGVSDLDVESIEIIPGASSALYGPDALQGLQYTRTKSPFDYKGLSASVKFGVNNVGKNFGAKPYTDVAIRYAQQIGKRFAFKINFSALNGTDFIADNYDDRSTRARKNFFVNDNTSKTTSIGYFPNNDPSTNLEYDGVNIYGDDINNGGAYSFPANFANSNLAGKLVTRTGYKELDLLGNNGKVYSYRANTALHYKITDRIEVIGSWYYGKGNFIRTAGFREYYPDYERHQVKLEIKGDEFFVRGYGTFQQAEGYNLGALAARLLQIAKPTGTWATDFANAYSTNNGNITASRLAADNNKFAVGSPDFNHFRDELINTYNNIKISDAGIGTVPKLNGVRLADNSSFTHTEGMYNFKKLLPANFEILTGASWRRYVLESKNTIFATGKASNIINEYGWYAQGSYFFKFTDDITLKPTVAVRYDKNDYFKGGFTPRASAVFSIGNHNFRGSWQSAFRNPSPNQLLSDGSIGEIGGTKTALEAGGLYSNPGYTEASVTAYRNSVKPASPNGDPSLLVKFVPQPDNFTTEKINTWEVGYKSIFFKKLSVDAYYFQSKYNNFIAAQNIIQPDSGIATKLLNTATSRLNAVDFNNKNEIYVNGAGIGLEYAIGKGFNIAGNYSYQVGRVTLKDLNGNILKDVFGNEINKRKMSDAVVSQSGRNFFISPENRFNITLSNANVVKNLGFAFTYRWTDKMWVEQGTTQGDIWLPQWQTVDAQVSLKLPKIKSVAKLGGTNLLNQYYSQGYGPAQIGGLYYVSLTFNQF